MSGSPGVTASAAPNPGGGMTSVLAVAVASASPGGSGVTTLASTFTSWTLSFPATAGSSGLSPSLGLVKSGSRASGGASSATTVSWASDAPAAGRAVPRSTAISPPIRATWTAPLATQAGRCFRSRLRATGPSALRITAGRAGLAGAVGVAAVASPIRVPLTAAGVLPEL
jgi:hypothetical protein